MTAYVIVNVKVTNPEQYKEYQKWSTLAMRAHDVKVLVRGGQCEVLEGRDPIRTVIMQFPSMDAARAWYHSDQYRRARNARAGAAEMNMYIVEGLS
jgi:uncharacterized protein (DUF1330 family)